MDTTLTAGDPGQDRVTTINFRTSQANQTLLVRWTVEAISLQYGNVTLQAAGAQRVRNSGSVTRCPTQARTSPE